MSNFLAVANVTAVLRDMLQEAALQAVPGAVVTTNRPEKTSGDQNRAGINLFLYQVALNTALRNANQPARSSNGSYIQQPQVALNLYYMLSFQGSDLELEPQRLMANALLALNARPILSQDAIQNAAQAKNYLAQSNLADQVEVVKLAPVQLSLEELSKLWSVFFQIPYVLSVAYQASVLVMESDETLQAALPVRRSNIYSAVLGQPVISQIVSEAGAGQPILAGSTLLILGRHLQGTGTQVRIAGQDVTPGQVADTAIQLPLSTVPPGSLRAGVQGLQVVQPLLMGTPPIPHRGVESNVAAFVLQPQIDKDPATGVYAISKSAMAGSGDGPFSGSITVGVTPPIGRMQRVVLLLNQVDSPSGTPAAYSFNAPPRDAAAPDTQPSIMIPVRGVNKGSYLVRLQVDGAESVLDFAGDRYAGPQVTIP